MYQELINFHGVEEVARRQLYDVLGTGRGAAYMLSHVERDLGSKWEVFSKSHFLTRWWHKLAAKSSFSFVLDCLKMTQKSLLYSLDIVKDVKAILILANMPTKPVLLIIVSVTSLCASELVKAFHLATRRGMSLLSRVGYFLASPLMPLLLNHQKCVLEGQLFHLASNRGRSDRQESRMTAVRKNLQEAMATMGELRGVENILEHSVQILVQLSVLHLPGYGLTDTDRYFFILST